MLLTKASKDILVCCWYSYVLPNFWVGQVN